MLSRTRSISAVIQHAGQPENNSDPEPLPNGFSLSRRSGNIPRQGHLMIREDYGGPDAPFDGTENVIEGIFRKLEAINSQLIANVG